MQEKLGPFAKSLGSRGHWPLLRNSKRSVVELDKLVFVRHLLKLLSAASNRKRFRKFLPIGSDSEAAEFKLKNFRPDRFSVFADFSRVRRLSDEIKSVAVIDFSPKTRRCLVLGK